MTKLGDDTYAAERDRHDDMVLSIALAARHREFINTHLERQNATIEQQAAQVAAYEERANRLAVENVRRTLGGLRHLIPARDDHAAQH